MLSCHQVLQYMVFSWTPLVSHRIWHVPCDREKIRPQPNRPVVSGQCCSIPLVFGQFSSLVTSQNARNCTIISHFVAFFLMFFKFYFSVSHSVSRSRMLLLHMAGGLDWIGQEWVIFRTCSFHETTALHSLARFHSGSANVQAKLFQHGIYGMLLSPVVATEQMGSTLLKHINLLVCGFYSPDFRLVRNSGQVCRNLTNLWKRQLSFVKCRK